MLQLRWCFSRSYLWIRLRPALFSSCNIKLLIRMLDFLQWNVWTFCVSHYLFQLFLSKHKLIDWVWILELVSRPPSTGMVIYPPKLPPSFSTQKSSLKIRPREENSGTRTGIIGSISVYFNSHQQYTNWVITKNRQVSNVNVFRK